MATNRRIFTSFAIEDVRLRDFLVGQARNERAPFSFVDMSVKEPWDDTWKTRCRTKIRGCDGAIAIITGKPQASGQLWELRVAYEENVPALLIYGYQGQLPPEPAGSCEGAADLHLDVGQHRRLPGEAVTRRRPDPENVRCERHWS